MIQECASTSIILFFQISLHVKTNEIPIYNLRHVGHIKPYSPLTSIERFIKHHCMNNNKWIECTAIINFYNTINSFTKNKIEEMFVPYTDARTFNRIGEFNMKSYLPEAQPMHRIYMTNPTAIMNTRSLPDLHGTLPAKTYPPYPTGILNQIPRPEVKLNNAWSTLLLHPHIYNPFTSSPLSTQANSSSNVIHNGLTLTPPRTMGVLPQQFFAHKNTSSINKFTKSLDYFERQFYQITFTKLLSISPVDRQENGMSFVQSGFYLLLTLMALSKEVDSNTRAEIDQCVGFKVLDMVSILSKYLTLTYLQSYDLNLNDSIALVRHFITTLPSSSDKLKLRQSSRLMLWPGNETTPRFGGGAAAALMLHVERFNGTETSDTIATILNQKVEIDTDGAIHDTFDEGDVSGGVTAVLVTTLYVRGRWRAAPTMLNGTRPFRDADNAPKRSVRMIRINDIMKYSDLNEWDAQALEISYATPGLTFLMLIPRGNSLKSLVQHVSNTSIGDITANMTTKRVAATVPIYTLRMTLLLPSKLQAMGIQRLVDVSNVTQASSFRLSHAVQRIMFWAEAGRNAYKDDGVEWDQSPDLEVVVDRPYIFFVRWRNVTLINGNFVL